MVFAGWSYKQTHTITSPSDLTDYQIKFVVYKTTGTSTDNIIYCNDHCNDDFSDIRFTIDNTTPLPYYVESYVSGTSAIVWVKLPSISSNTTLYVHYGNTSATDASSGSDTFDFFDDFSNATIDSTKWNTSGSYSIANGLCTITNGSIWSTSTFTDGYTLVARITKTSTTSDTANIGFNDGTSSIGSNYVGVFKYGTTTPKVQVKRNGAFTLQGSCSTWCDATYRTLQVKRFVGGTFVKWYTDNTDLYASGCETINFTNSMHLYFTNTTSGSLSLDFVGTVKCAATEPTHSTWGIEVETTPASPIISGSLISNPSSGTYPLTTTLTAGFSLPVIDAILHFDDFTSYNIGSIATNFSTTHTYTTFGTYHPYITAYNTQYDKVVDAYATVTVNAPTVTASFTTSINQNVVTCTDTSTGLVNEWYWDFGDGGNSDEQNPSHVYHTPGTYTITLYVSNQQVSTLTTSTVTINEPTPSATIETTPRDDYAIPSLITFTCKPSINESLRETITSVEWNINGEIQTGFTVTDLFNEIGSHTITCTVINNYGNSYTTSITITLDYKLDVNFKPALHYVIGVVPTTVQFTNLSIPTTATWYWTFGDGETSTSKDPSHTFATYGTYTVSLTATNSTGSSTKTYTDAIKIRRKARYLYDTIAVTEETRPMQIRLLQELVELTEKTYTKTRILRDLVTSIQKNLPEIPGQDEYGRFHTNSRFNEFGHLIIDTLTGIGRRITRAVQMDDKTGLKQARARILTEEIIIEETIEEQP